jgi:phosphomannomutase
MITKSIFKAYDIRGIYPKDVNQEAVEVVGKACVKMFPEGEVIVAYDARHGSPELARILENAITTEAAAHNKHITIRAVGFSTTPMFYFLVNHFKAVGGCMITASHNPKEYNGIKIVSEGAVTVSGTDILKIVETL